MQWQMGAGRGRLIGAGIGPLRITVESADTELCLLFDGWNDDFVVQGACLPADGRLGGHVLPILSSPTRLLDSPSLRLRLMPLFLSLRGLLDV